MIVQAHPMVPVLAVTLPQALVIVMAVGFVAALAAIVYLARKGLL